MIARNTLIGSIDVRQWFVDIDDNRTSSSLQLNTDTIDHQRAVVLLPRVPMKFGSKLYWAKIG